MLIASIIREPENQSATILPCGTSMPTPPTPAMMRPAAILARSPPQALTQGPITIRASPTPVTVRSPSQRPSDEGAQQHVGAEQFAELGIGEVEQRHQVRTERRDRLELIAKGNSPQR